MVLRPHKFTSVNWYESDASKLIDRVKWSYLHNKGPKKLPEMNDKSDSPILGVISPHAGLTCSGPFAAHGFLALAESHVDTFIVLGTNHTGSGARLSIFPDGNWETPLGLIPIDSNLSHELLRLNENNLSNLNLIREPEAHLSEHSIDNQLPFLLYSFSNFKILPICLMDHSLETCDSLGKLLAKLIIENKEKSIKIVASSDFTHYENADEAKKRDEPVINALLKYDLKKAAYQQQNLKASICGFGPILTLLSTAKTLKCNLPEVLCYGHSGETCGGMDSVVAYASIRVDLSKSTNTS